MPSVNVTYTNVLPLFTPGSNNWPEGWQGYNPELTTSVSVQDSKVRFVINTGMYYTGENENKLFELKRDLYTTDMSNLHFFSITVTNKNITCTGSFKIKVGLIGIDIGESGNPIVSETVLDEREFTQGTHIFNVYGTKNFDTVYFFIRITQGSFTHVSTGEVIVENPVGVNLATTSFPSALTSFFSPTVTSWTQLANQSSYAGTIGWTLKGKTWLSYFFRPINGTGTLSIDISPITFLSANSLVVPNILYSSHEANLSTYIVDEAKYKHSSYSISANNLPSSVIFDSATGYLRINPLTGEYSEINQAIPFTFSFTVLGETARTEPFIVYYTRTNYAPNITLPTEVSYKTLQTFQVVVTDEDITKTTSNVEYTDAVVSLVSTTTINGATIYTFQTKPITTLATGFVRVYATDVLGASSSSTLNFQVVPRTLTISYTTPTPLTEGTSGQVTLSAVDEDNQPVSLSNARIFAESSKLNVNVFGNTIVYSVNSAAISEPFVSDTIYVSVLLEGYSPAEIQISIVSSNLPPVWQTIPAISCQAGSVTLIPISDYVSNPEGSNYIVKFISDCPFAYFAFSPQDSKWYMRLVPTLAHIGTKEYSISAIDTFSAISTTTMSITVDQPTDLPSLNIPLQQTFVGKKLRIYLDAYLKNIYPYEITNISIIEGPGTIKEE